MKTGREIHVRMCEMETGSGDDLLRTTLGSCVGIGLLWRNRDLCGLAHCLLPEGSSLSEEKSAKYVTEAIPSLLALMGAAPSQRHQLEAVVAGGACMVINAKPAPYGLIGEQNTRMAQKLLEQAGIRVVHTDVGGTRGRQLRIDCAQKTYLVNTIDRTH
jgi:chemotaxis protein CheD